MRTLFLALGLLCSMANATSQFSDAKRFSINGFATLGAEGIDSNDRYLDEFQTNKAHTVDYTLGSHVGINVTSQLNDKSRLVLQTIMQGTQDDFAPKIDLAFVNIETAKNLQLLAGRIVSPLWMFSEEQSLGYSQLWLQPPYQLYGRIPFRNMDGGGLRYNYALGSTLLKLQVVGGSGRYTSRENPPGAKIEADVRISDILATELRIERDPAFAMRLGYIQANVSVDTTVELIGVVPAGPLGNLNGRLNSVQNIRSARMYSVGANGQIGPVLYVAEAMQTESKSSSLSLYRADYFTLGYQVGDWTPHFTGAWQWAGDGTFFNTQEGDGMNSGSESLKLGLNYAGFENIVLKIGGGTTREYFVGRKNNEYNLYSVSANVVF